MPTAPQNAKAKHCTRLALERELKQLKNVEHARILAKFFKSGKGEYGEGALFLGIKVPPQRKLAKRFAELPLADIRALLKSPFHEFRFTAAEILVFKFERANAKDRHKIFAFYLRNASRFNNWDLVDTSAPYLIGEYLLEKDPAILYELARSKDLWKRRIAIVATLRFIRAGVISHTFAISELLLNDEHDLIHKATGWALREAGRVSRRELLAFLEAHYKRLPRTTLRYAIEHLSPADRRNLLQGDFAGAKKLSKAEA